MTMAITFDTLKYVEKLKAAGVSEPQAKAMSEAQQEVFSEALNTTLATKTDIFAIRHEMSELRQELTQDMSELRQELKQDMSELRAEVKQEITEVKSEMKLIKWILGVLVTGTLALVLKAFFGG